MKNVKKIIIAALITMVATSLIGCNMIEKTPEGIAKSTVAKVFDAKVTRGQVDEQLVGVKAQLVTQYGANYATNTEAMAQLASQKDQIVQGLITEQIVNYEATKLKLVPTEAKLNEEINAQLVQIKKSLGTDAKYKEALAQANLTEEALKARIRPSVIQDVLYTEVTKGVTTTEAKEKEYYNSNLTEFSEGTIHIAHILVPTQAEAVAIKKQLDAGEAFATVAKAKGTDATKDKGGDLGTLKFTDTTLDPTFMAAALKLPSGTVSEPVQTQFGWHIIKMIEKKSSKPKAFTAVKSTIEKKLITTGKESAWAAKMKVWQADANITNYPNNL